MKCNCSVWHPSPDRWIVISNLSGNLADVYNDEDRHDRRVSPLEGGLKHDIALKAVDRFELYAAQGYPCDLQLAIEFEI